MMVLDRTLQPARNRPAWAKPDLPPGRAYGDVAHIMTNIDALKRTAPITGFAHPPEVGPDPCDPLRQEFKP